MFVISPSESPPIGGAQDGILTLIPSARVGFVGLERDEETAKPVSYYAKLPYQIDDGISIVIDPMLATGGSTAGTRPRTEPAARTSKWSPRP